VTGIGLLGGGAIVRHGLTVKGLTTAASIWATASIGVAVGAGSYEMAAGGSVLVVGTLVRAAGSEEPAPALVGVA
jgi:putative Mg2+ transporter-C (MgtC) family protein